MRDRMTSDEALAELRERLNRRPARRHFVVSVFDGNGRLMGAVHQYDDPGSVTVDVSEVAF